MKISILGGGSWGTALAVHLAKKNHTITMWEFFQEQAQKMHQDRFCPLLPDAKLPENISVYSNMEPVLSDSELILVVVPSDKVESTMEKAKPFLKNQPIIVCSKGFANNTQLLSDVMKQYSSEVYCLYGPTHAEEVCKGLFSGIVLAGSEGKEKIKDIFETDTFKVDLSDDLVGVQVCAALKNILAVFIGVLDGMGLGDNAKAFVMTKGLQEIQQVGIEWGALPETFLGLAGMGDVIVTCTSQHSRNRFAGQEVGKGNLLDDVLKGMAMVAEGVTTAQCVPELVKRFNVNIPLLQGLYDILFTQKNPEQVLREL
ncbi:NAD(P)-dependent glycerol-3-phosphate dehydrogenase [Candidatus Woesearchaeota archaeon]|jgi:glycerol-3-phosphate dehydrogenase (NAD(P)+)|nr:NAD(P)-dependent glycerol-3-phosphate dehydrogenase [Candidatus Woesearchaeota archaeon]MBT5397301.1 NAD(P)-dependent glycerol-3-phosphate dehydrogenase [Candidatus Woesearchaeota archaeon]MBT5924274.1 NAD(P)-dependent glycerol-3-phosphate dehydrogenase [Candidatus Woesearchaeota archaeon]MBT6367854.1 NAD(P)-dependent glycerol-3-phosphate dehydrogenase [Candidatus Woesearchaeota archaeon]MBT7762701.1 NAD(P)-dependent glycerol-3-phosphate dehydrogenase [Candidatus Woesearchaeota archaeon]